MWPSLTAVTEEVTFSLWPYCELVAASPGLIWYCCDRCRKRAIRDSRSCELRLNDRLRKGRFDVDEFSRREKKVASKYRYQYAFGLLLLLLPRLLLVLSDLLDVFLVVNIPTGNRGCECTVRWISLYITESNLIADTFCEVRGSLRRQELD